MTQNTTAPQKSRHRTRQWKPQDFSEQCLSGTSFLSRNLQGADFSGADLRGADLRGADLFGARLRRTDLRGCQIDATRLVEIWVPNNLARDVVNQIRAFDFKHGTTRWVAPVIDDEAAALPCPYADATMKPVLYEWGSRTWEGGRGWVPPASVWTLEEIIAAVLDELGCLHDLMRPLRGEASPHHSPTWITVDLPRLEELAKA